MRLADGDALAALKAETYEKNGETKLSLSNFSGCHRDTL
jgi:hypothetical protein